MLGATSGMVMAALRNFAADGASFFLAARDGEKLTRIAEDLKVRGASAVTTYTSDLAGEGAALDLFNAATSSGEFVDCMLLGYGTLTDQKRGEGDLAYASHEIRVNFTSAMEHCLIWANYFEAQKKGQIAVITSVAGDRGRQSNYIYGSAKGGMSLFLQGLRNRLSKAGVAVTTIKPGFVDTPMTGHLKKGPLFASAQAAGDGIYRAIKAQKDVVYVPKFWWLILSIVCAIPERIFKRLSL